MRVVILTQEDSFFIPKNIDRVNKVCEVVEVVNLDGKGSLNNKINDFIKWFGIIQVLNLGLRVFVRKVQNALDILSGYRIMGGYCSVKAISIKSNIQYQSINNVNDNDFFNHIESLNPDLIISFSAPQVIKEPLLSYPKYGIINVHGSLLPDYRGCLPSFWYLYNNEKWGGATVHYMSAKIDDGGIILQDKVLIEECKSMFEVMNKTKILGGDLMVNTILKIQNQTVEVKPNKITEGRYFSWPTLKEAKEFRMNGKRLV